jgi:hypothetical protein
MGIGYHTKLTLEQYKQAIELKKRIDETPTMQDLGRQWGIAGSTIVNAVRKGIKRYDYIMARERAEKMKQNALQRQRDKEAKAQGVLKEMVRSQQEVGTQPRKETKTRVPKEVVRLQVE